MTVRRVAIIGGGSSGITAVKACIEEGLEAVCFERTSEIGGLWRYTEDSDEKRGCVMKSTIINTSKEMSAYSDFPPPADFPNFMHNSKMMEYLDMYADKYGMRPHIIVGHEVLSVSPVTEGSDRWKVRVRNSNTAVESEDIYDGILICTGHHCFPRMPEFLGQEKFKGRILHTHEYKKPSTFEDRQVCVVGVGNSGGDAAVELSSVAEQVYLSARGGSWVLQRVADNGIPYDLQILTKWNNFLFQTLPYRFTCWVFERRADRRFDHELYNMKPARRIFGQHSMVNDCLPHRILSGTVKVKGDIKQFTEQGIIFNGDSEETPIDDVVFATGYKVEFPFFDETLISCQNNRMDLYKMIFSPEHPTLAFIGMAQPQGPLMPLSELQCRYVARVLSGKLKLPSKQEMRADIELYKRIVSARFADTPRHASEVDWLPYMESIAGLLGVKPNLLKLLFTDPTLWAKLTFGPSFPYQYRLDGPGKWSQARNTILGAEERVRATLQTKNRNVKARKTENSVTQFVKIVLAFLFVVFTASFALRR